MGKIEDKDIDLHIDRETLLQEYIPKDQYEARLKADLEAILVELQLEIEELDTPNNGSAYMDCVEIIQQKINALKENNHDD